MSNLHNNWFRIHSSYITKIKNFDENITPLVRRNMVSYYTWAALLEASDIPVTSKNISEHFLVEQENAGTYLAMLHRAECLVENPKNSRVYEIATKEKLARAKQPSIAGLDSTITQNSDGTLTLTVEQLKSLIGA